MRAIEKEIKIETEEERETHLLGPRISSRWSFVRREIHSTFTYRRTSAIVNSLNKLFQLHRQRRGPLATENWNLWRILWVESGKAVGLSAHWDTKSWTVHLSLFLPSPPPLAFVLLVLFSEQLCKLILIPFWRNVYHLQTFLILGMRKTNLIDREVWATRPLRETISLENCCIISRLRRTEHSFGVCKKIKE